MNLTLWIQRGKVALDEVRLLGSGIHSVINNSRQTKNHFFFRFSISRVWEWACIISGRIEMFFRSRRSCK